LRDSSYPAKKKKNENGFWGNFSARTYRLAGDTKDGYLRHIG